jgi:hypothetical protein
MKIQRNHRQQLRDRGEMKKFPFKTSQQIFYISASCFMPQIRDRIIKSGIKKRVCCCWMLLRNLAAAINRVGSVRAQVHTHTHIWGEQVRATRRQPVAGAR